MADCVESGSAELPELIVIRWNGQEFKVSGLSGAATIGDLKTAISALTGVRPDRQKLFGLKHAGNYNDNYPLVEKTQIVSLSGAFTVMH